MSRRVSVGLVGAGLMGANHARIVATSTGADLSVVVDRRIEQAERLARPAGAVAATTVDALDRCDAVIVACPTEHHAVIALDLIGQGIPVLVEKPLAAVLAEAEAIVQAAGRHGVVVTCGFVERFNPAVTTAVGLVDQPPVHIVATRHSPPTPRVATSVVDDLLIHDIDLALRLVSGEQVAVVAGAAPVHPTTGTAELADCILQFSGGAVATLSASRVSQRKIRSLLLSMPSRLVEVDLLRQDVTVYHNVGQGQGGTPPDYRAQTIVDIPFVRHAGEPLALQFEHFLRLVRGDADPAVERASLLGPHRVASGLRGPGPIGDGAVMAGAVR